MNLVNLVTVVMTEKLGLLDLLEILEIRETKDHKDILEFEAKKVSLVFLDNLEQKVIEDNQDFLVYLVLKEEKAKWVHLAIQVKKVYKVHLARREVFMEEQGPLVHPVQEDSRVFLEYQGCQDLKEKLVHEGHKDPLGVQV